MPIPVHAEGIPLPKPGVMVPLSAPHQAPVFKGIKIDPNDPFKFDFILDSGTDGFPVTFGNTRHEGTKTSGNDIQHESQKLIKYFLAALTIPEKDLWVNLSPYEQDRIVPEGIGQTEMGRDLLAQDYLLKQITATLMYPEGKVGKAFWAKLYASAAKTLGTTDIAVSTFNKVWIVPEKAVVYENSQKGTAYIVQSSLNVMLEEDYTAMALNSAKDGALTRPTAALERQILKEIIIPELKREVNEGQNFAPLRQMYHSLILANWFKRKLHTSVLGKTYVDQGKMKGIDSVAKKETQEIYAQYIAAFKKGVYNYVKEDNSPVAGPQVPRKYFSGGMTLSFGENVLDIVSDGAMIAEQAQEQLHHVSFSVKPVRRPSDPAMTSPIDQFIREYAAVQESTEEAVNALVDILSDDRQAVEYFNRADARWDLFPTMLSSFLGAPERSFRVTHAITFFKVINIFRKKEPQDYWKAVVNVLVNGKVRNVGAVNLLIINLNKDVRGTDNTGIVKALMESKNPVILRYVWSIMIEPLYFSNPKVFNQEMKQIIDAVYKDFEEYKYMLYYRTFMENVQFSGKDAKFPLHASVRQRLKKGPKKVIMIHNIIDGLGDERIRVMTLLQGLLEFNPDLTVDIFTSRPYLYHHPRVNAQHVPEDVHSIDTDIYDAFILYGGESVNATVEKTNGLMLNLKWQDFVRTGRVGVKVGGQFRHDKSWAVVERYTVDMKMENGANVYANVFHLMAELGLPVRVGTVRFPSAQIVPNDSVLEHMWQGLIQKNAEQRPVLFFNGFGGAHRRKGITDINEFSRVISDMVLQGFFVIMATDVEPWSDQHMAGQIMSRLEEDVRQHVVTGPIASERPGTYEYMIIHSDLNVMIEGAVMHAAYDLGTRFIVIQIDQEYPFWQWVPLAADRDQQIAITRLSELPQALKKFVPPGNPAMITPLESVPTGGIDLRKSEATDIQSDGQGAAFPINTLKLQAAQDALGFTPVVLDIQPLPDLKAFLGIQ